MIAAPRRVEHYCTGCGREYGNGRVPFCACGHFLDVRYDLQAAVLRDSADPYVRYFDLLPLERMESLRPSEHGMTPCRHAKALGRSLGLHRLYLKDETVLPTGTTKDRMAAVSLAYLHEMGVRSFCAASTGNSSTSYAHGIRRYPDMKVYLFAGEDFLDRLQVASDSEQVVVFALRGATFVEAYEEARRYAERKGLHPEAGFFNPGRRMGLKTAFLEAVEVVPDSIDWYVQAVSSAMGVYGVYKGAKELVAMGRIERPPRLLAVQQETNKPMVTAFEAGSPVIRPQDVVAKPTGIATAILRGNPSRVYPHVREIILESHGALVAVTEQQIRDARRRVEELEGVDICFNSAAAVAGMIRLARRGEIAGNETVLVNLTGRERERIPPPRVYWLERTNAGWQLEDKHDPRAADLWEGEE